MLTKNRSITLKKKQTNMLIMTESLLYYTFITFKLCLKILFRETHSQMMKRRKNLLNRKQFKG